MTIIIHIYNVPFLHFRPHLLVRRKRHRIRAGHPPKTQATSLQDHLHGRTTGGTRTRLRKNPVPRRLHPRRTRSKDQANRSPRASVVLQQKGPPEKTAQLPATERVQHDVSPVRFSRPAPVRRSGFQPEHLGAAELRFRGRFGHHGPRGRPGRPARGALFGFLRRNRQLARDDDRERGFQPPGAGRVVQRVQLGRVGAGKCLERRESVWVQHAPGVSEPARGCAAAERGLGEARSEQQDEREFVQLA